MAHAFKDSTFLWVVWQRGDKPGDVQEVLGLYRSRGDALFEAQLVDADGLTPVKDKVLAAMLKLMGPTLIERPLRGVVTGAK